MVIHEIESRLKNLERALAKVAEGEFDQSVRVADSDDTLSNLEMGFNFMLMDLRHMRKLDREKEQRLAEQRHELESRLATIEHQAAAIEELSTPIMKVWDEVLVLPIIGVVDTRRSAIIMARLLDNIASSQARCVILDLTGVKIADTGTADYLLKIARAAGLLGTRIVMTGLSAAGAQTLVEIGVELGEVRTLGTLRDGLRDCMAYLDGCLDPNPAEPQPNRPSAVSYQPSGGNTDR